LNVGLTFGVLGLGGSSLSSFFSFSFFFSFALPLGLSAFSLSAFSLSAFSFSAYSFSAFFSSSVGFGVLGTTIIVLTFKSFL